LDRQPETASCQDQSHYSKEVEDVALLTLHFPRNVIAIIHVSWLDPNKIHRMSIVGSRKMLVYDDTATQEKLRIYDRGVIIMSSRTTTPSAIFSSRTAMAIF
jgi:predicted dehydrogenase